MPLTFVLDEDMRGPLWDAIQHHNLLGLFPIDATRVGDLPDLPLGTKDPGLLLWAERSGRIIVTEDKNTMPGHLTAHLQAGHHSPGVFIVRKSGNIAAVVSLLATIAHASEPWEWQDSYFFIP